MMVKCFCGSRLFSAGGRCRLFVGVLEQYGIITLAEQQVAQAGVRNIQQFLPPVQIEQTTQAHPDKEHDPRRHADGRGRAGKDQQNETDNGCGRADEADGLAPSRFRNIRILVQILVGGQAGVQIGQGCADGGHVHDPDQGGPAEPGHDEAERQGKDHTLPGRIVAGMHGGKEIGQEFAASHAEQQAGGGHEETVHARQNARQNRHGQGHATPAPENLIRHPAGGPGMVLAQQLFVGNEPGHTHRDKSVNDGAADDRKQHQIPRLVRGKGKFLGGLGDSVETHVQPGGQGQHHQHTGQGRTVFRKKRLKVA